MYLRNYVLPFGLIIVLVRILVLHYHVLLEILGLEWKIRMTQRTTRKLIKQGWRFQNLFVRLHVVFRNLPFFASN